MSTASALFAGCLAFAYAIPIHAVPTDGDQTSPKTVRWKCLVSVGATLMCIATTHLAMGAGWGWLGLGCTRLGLLLPTALFTLLFLGPLVHQALDRRRGVHAPSAANAAVATRTLLVAPVAEELTFRCCIGAILTRGGHSPACLIGLSPLLFGAAHLPHLRTLLQEGIPWQQAVVGKAVQMLYTSAFGSLAMFVYLRTGCAASPVLLHAACNYAGVPDFGGLAHHPQRGPLRAAYLVGILATVALLWTQHSPLLHLRKLQHLTEG